MRCLCASLFLCVLVACSSAPKPAPTPTPTPLGPPPAPEPPQAAARARAPGEAWLEKPAPHGVELGVDDPASVAKKLGVALELAHCKKNGAHWSRPKAGKLKGNYRCPIAEPKLDGGKQLELFFVDLGDGVIVLDALDIAFDAAEWESRIAALEAEWGRADVSFTSPDRARSWSFGRVEIALERAPGKPLAHLRYADRHAARRYLARVIKTHKVPRIVPRPKTIPPIEPHGLHFARDDEESSRQKLRTAGFDGDACRPLAEHTHEGRVIDCVLSGTPLPGLRSARIQLVDVGDGALRLSLLEYSYDPARYARVYGAIEAQYGAVEHETEGTDDLADWWVGPVQISVLGNSTMLLVSYRHGRLSQIGANLIARSNQAGRTGR